MWKKIHNEEDGIVLITSLLFLMVVTFLAIAGIQNPKTDIVISSNDRYATQSQQLANLAIMEAKNWLLIHHSNSDIPRNIIRNGQLFAKVAQPTDTTLPSYNFNTHGIVPCVSQGGDDTNACSRVTNSPKIVTTVNSKNYNIGDYSWRVVHLSGNDTADVDSSLGTTSGILSEYRSRKRVFENEGAALDQSSAYKEFYYIYSTGEAYMGLVTSDLSSNIIAESEAVVSYKQIIPNMN
ncbi:hypothetical protein JXR93_02255 [bacterium]|nr:hypothetical protein [bacterium]